MPHRTGASSGAGQSTLVRVRNALVSRVASIIDRFLWVVWLLAAASIGVALWFSTGPWSVVAQGQSYACGSPFMDRYRTTSFDPAATAAYSCWREVSESPPSGTRLVGCGRRLGRDRINRASDAAEAHRCEARPPLKRVPAHP